MTTTVQMHVPFLDLKAQYASIRDEVEEAVHSVLESAHFVGGERVERFEDEFARYTGARCAVGVGSGTAALELALRAEGIGAGDEVIVPANTFFATAEAVTNIGAKPVFADVDPVTFHLTPHSVESARTPKTRAVIPVHLYGRAIAMEGIERLASSAGLRIIEDACQAHGVRRKGVSVGSSGWLTCFSFYPGKNLGAYGDGGAITCNDPDMAKTLRILRDHGSPSKYHHVMVGTNSRLDAIQAAVLSVKLRHLDHWNAQRVRYATALSGALDGGKVLAPEIPPVGEHNFHLYVVLSHQRDALRDFLREHGIDTGIHYPVPLHLTPAYKALNGHRRGYLPVVESLAERVLSLPMYSELTPEQIDHVATTLNEFWDRN